MMMMRIESREFVGPPPERLLFYLRLNAKFVRDTTQRLYLPSC